MMQKNLLKEKELKETKIKDLKDINIKDIKDIKDNPIKNHEFKENYLKNKYQSEQSNYDFLNQSASEIKKLKDKNKISTTENDNNSIKFSKNKIKN